MVEELASDKDSSTNQQTEFTVCLFVQHILSQVNTSHPFSLSAETLILLYIMLPSKF